MLRAGLASLISASVLVFAQVQPSVQVTAPLTKTGNRLGIRPSTTAVSGSMSAVQSSDLAFLLAGGAPTATPSPADPSLYYGGRIFSTGVVSTYFSDSFSRADVANINGTAIENGGVNWQVHNIGAGSSLTETVGVTSHVLQCTANCSGPGGYGDPGIVIDTSRADVAVNATLPTYPLLTFNLFGLRMLPATGSPLAFPSGFYVYNSAFTSLNHICIGGFGAGAPGETCGAGFPSSASPVIVTASISGNTITVTLSGLSAPSVSVTSSYQNTATIHGVALQHSVVAPGFTAFSVTSPLVPKSLNLRGYYANGMDTATFTVGEDANSGTGGAEFSDTTHAPFALDQSQLTSAVPVGTPPMIVTSTTKVTNWNADLLDGHDSSYFQVAGSYVTAACSNTLGLAWGTVSSLDTTRFTGQTCTGAVLGDECNVSVDTTLPTGAVLTAQGDGSNTVLVEAACVKATGCTFASQNTKVICWHH